MMMHGSHGDDHEHEKVRKGKVITYRDIIKLGLDETQLKGVDLTKLLKDNEREYDDWQRDLDAFKVS
jgi:hypothetical protein